MAQKIKNIVDFDPFNTEEVVRDYAPLSDMSMPLDESHSFKVPKEEKINELKQETMQKKNHKNYTFNNCTVTINEEGKAIGILEEKEKSTSQITDMMMTITKSISDSAISYFKAREEKLKTEQPQPIIKPDLKKRKAPVKKAVKKTAKKK
jgi:hypothetical protein